MAKFQLKDGLVLQRGKQLLKFQRMLPDNLIQFENMETGLIEKFSIEELLEKIEGKEILVQGGNHAGNAVSVKLPNAQSSVQVVIDTDRLSAKAKATYERKINYVLRCQRAGVMQGSLRQLSKMVGSIGAEIGDKNPPGGSTVAVWLRIYNRSGCDNRSLLPKPRSARKIGERLGEAKLEIINEFIKRYYLQRNGKSIEETYIFLSSEMRTRFGKDAYVSLSTVKKIISKISPYERTKIRKGTAFAAAKWRHSIGGINAEYPLQVVEIDHTELSIYVIDSKIGVVLGKPIITVIIDSCTSYILSLVVSFEGTTVGRVVKAIKFALTPKNKIVAELGLKNEWITPGLWQTMLTDNASEFHAADTNAIAMQIGFDVERSPVRKPWFKPGVERSMLAVVNALPQYGRSELILGVHKPIDPKKTACVAFEDLRNGLIEWAVDIYPFKISERTLDCPFDRMKEGLKRVPAPIFNDDLRALEIFAAIPTRVKVSHAGIEKYYLDYRSRELAEMAKKYGPKFDMDARLDPADLGGIWIQEPKVKTWHWIPVLQKSYADGLSLTAHRIIRMSKATELRRSKKLEHYQDAVYAIEMKWQAKIKAGKLTIREAKKMAVVQEQSNFKRPATRPSLDKVDSVMDRIPEAMPVLNQDDLPPITVIRLDDMEQ